MTATGFHEDENCTYVDITPSLAPFNGYFLGEHRLAGSVRFVYPLILRREPF